MLAFDGSTWRFGYSSDSNANLALDETSAWLGLSDDGLRRFDRSTLAETAHYTPDDSPLPSDRVCHGLDVDSKGVVWVGQTGHLTRFPPD